MSSVGQQRAAIAQFANSLDWTKLKRAGVISRQSEGEYLIQMLHDAVQTLASVPEPKPTKVEGKW